MLRNVKSCLLAAALAGFLELPVAAQTNAVPEWHGRWRISTTSPSPKAVTIHYYLPPECDDETLRSTTTWNNAGSYFKYSDPVVSDAGSQPPDSPYMLGYVYLREGDLESHVLMNATWDSVASTGSGLPTIYGAIIRVNTDFLYYGTDDRSGMFFCGSPDILDSQEHDYESVMLHEIAHAFGFRHGSDPNCPMYPSYIKGVSRRFPCPDESQSFRDLYDPAVTPY